MHQEECSTSGEAESIFTADTLPTKFVLRQR